MLVHLRQTRFCIVSIVKARRWRLPFPSLITNCPSLSVPGKCMISTNTTVTCGGLDQSLAFNVKFFARPFICASCNTPTTHRRTDMSIVQRPPTLLHRYECATATDLPDYNTVVAQMPAAYRSPPLDDTDDEIWRFDVSGVRRERPRVRVRPSDLSTQRPRVRRESV